MVTLNRVINLNERWFLSESIGLDFDAKDWQKGKTNMAQNRSA